MNSPSPLHLPIYSVPRSSPSSLLSLFPPSFPSLFLFSLPSFLSFLPVSSPLLTFFSFHPSPSLPLSSPFHFFVQKFKIWAMWPCCRFCSDWGRCLRFLVVIEMSFQVVHYIVRYSLRGSLLPMVVLCTLKNTSIFRNSLKNEPRRRFHLTPGSPRFNLDWKYRDTGCKFHLKVQLGGRLTTAERDDHSL